MRCLTTGAPGCGGAVLRPSSLPPDAERGRAHRKHDTVSERLRRWTRNPLGSARRGSNPLGVVLSRRMQRRSSCFGGVLLQRNRSEHKASRGFEPRSLDSESRVLTVTPRGRLVARRPRRLDLCFSQVKAPRREAMTELLVPSAHLSCTNKVYIV